ncbi:Tn7-like element transposition protein TnsE [Paenibacillus cisolokensis]|uniref:Tn7-like element transposition protein TnsE n=1 Tax=Paenibacillus cisolokensis TaxID=1658519 RepID=UPI003D2D5D60
MAALTLRSWPFPENQEVELFWFGSPFMDYKGNWRIRVAFRKATGDLKVVSYPWGTVPYLRLGQIYTNGVYDQIKPLSGTVYKITLSSLDQSLMSNGFKLPKRLIDFRKNPELGLQKIIQFQSDGLTYCIPVFEFIRAMFINSRYLAYYLMQPHGLEMLVDYNEMRGKTLHFDLSFRVPAKLATDSNARHLSWIYIDPDIRSMWNSVYHLMFSQAIKDSPQNPNARMKKGIPLSVELPAVGPLEFHVRGEQFIDYVLVKEILGIGGFKHPVEEIVFWHPSKKRRESISGDKQVRITPRSENDDYILNDQSENARENARQDVLETPPTFMRFSNYPRVTTRRENVRNSHTGNDVIVTSGRGGKNSGGMEEVSTQDTMVGGDTPPIDFQTLETIPITEAIGLESFFEMIQILKHIFPGQIRMSVLRIPSGKRFSVCPNGSRRACAIVQADHGIVTKFVIEVARPDDWSISTLILHPIQQTSIKTIERDIKLLLEGLVQKGGHWDQNVLNQCNGLNIEKVKHYQSDSIRDWAYRIIGKLSG